MGKIPALADLAGIRERSLPIEPPPPEVPAGHRVVFLLDASTGLEDRLLRGWVDRLGLDIPRDVVSLAPSRIRRRGRRTDPAIDEMLDSTAWLVPLRVAWMPAERRGRRVVSWADVLKLGDPRDPRWFRDYLILALHPDRVRIVVGQGASASDLVADKSPECGTLVDFVTRRAWRALDRAERAAHGDRYKISRFVAEDILSRPWFREQVVRLARGRGLPEAVSLARARYYLAEIAAKPSPFIIDLIANFIHWIYSQGYGGIHYDREAVAEIAQLGREYPVAFLPSHRSNLDRLALQFMLWENDLPPNHTAGGINLNFFPVGPLIRRTGVFFIRRTFRGNELYKFVLREYLEYLIGKRFPLEWYMEGGRSRSGKLRPPRFGMLTWVVEAVAAGKAEDVYLLPISITYDHIHDVAAYADEAAGGVKEKESLAWALRFIGGLRRRSGDIHISFADPISVNKELPGSKPLDEEPTEIQKVAFEVMYRIGSVTPITTTSVVSIALLAAKGTAMGGAELVTACSDLVGLIQQLGLPTTLPLHFGTTDEVESVLAGMEEHGLVSRHSAGNRTVYWMEPGQMLRASYHRNTVVHFFVPRALAEIAFDSNDLDSFWTDLMELRDLLKFEFFFAEKEQFRLQVASQLEAESPGWEQEVSNGRGTGIDLHPSTAGWAVLPLLEAYMVVADELAVTDGPLDEKSFLAVCLDRGRLYRLEERISSDESVSKVLYGGALLLAENRGLTSGETPRHHREVFAREIAGYVERVG